MSGLAFACEVVMPPRPNGRMFPPKMKMGVLSVMFACQQHDAAQIVRLAIKEGVVRLLDSHVHVLWP